MANCGCAADAVIWAGQQLAAIPGWLLKYQNARLDQEGHLTSIKRPKHQELFTARRGGTRWRPKPSPPHPQWWLGAQTMGFSEKATALWKKRRIWEKSGRFEANSQVTSLGGGPWRIFPKSADFLIIIKLMIFSRNFLNKKAAWRLCLGDVSVKQHLPLGGELWN